MCGWSWASNKFLSKIFILILLSKVQTFFKHFYSQLLNCYAHYNKNFKTNNALQTHKKQAPKQNPKCPIKILVPKIERKIS